MKEGLLLCPFGSRVLQRATTEWFWLQAAEDLFPPYRLVLGEARSLLLVRNWTLGGKTLVMSDFVGLSAQGEPIVCGEVFGPQLLPFWGPPCPKDGAVGIQIENPSAATVNVTATLIASPAPEVTQTSLMGGILRKTDSSYWR